MSKPVPDMGKIANVFFEEQKRLGDLTAKNSKKFSFLVSYSIAKADFAG